MKNAKTLTVPIVFVFKTLTPAENGCSQLGKEATTVYWRFIKCYNFFLGINLHLLKPNLCILFSIQTLPATTISGLLIYFTLLSEFNYNIEHEKS